MTGTLTTTELDQRAQLAALMAPTPEQGIHPSEFAEPGAHTLIRKTLITRDKPEAREIDGDAGNFEALVSTWQTDRQQEAFVPGAFADTIHRWRQSGKQLPVLFAHNASDPSMLIGSIDPSQMYETSEGLHVKGRLDLEARRGQDVYDLLKRGAPLGWSVGFLALPANTVKQGARRLIKKVSELLEVSITPTPANAGVRTIAIKGVEFPRHEPEPLLSRDEVEARLVEAGLLAEDPAVVALREDAYRHTLNLLGHSDKAVATRSKATGPVHIATFTC
jgi:HK97 family phage prohead protease